MAFILCRPVLIRCYFTIGVYSSNLGSSWNRRFQDTMDLQSLWFLLLMPSLGWEADGWYLCTWSWRRLSVAGRLGKWVESGLGLPKFDKPKSNPNPTWIWFDPSLLNPNPTQIFIYNEIHDENAGRPIFDSNLVRIATWIFTRLEFGCFIADPNLIWVIWVDSLLTRIQIWPTHVENFGLGSGSGRRMGLILQDRVAGCWNLWNLLYMCVCCQLTISSYDIWCWFFWSLPCSRCWAWSWWECEYIANWIGVVDRIFIIPMLRVYPLWSWTSWTSSLIFTLKL